MDSEVVHAPIVDMCRLHQRAIAPVVLGRHQVLPAPASAESSQPTEATEHTCSLQSAMLGAAEALGLVIAVLKPTCPSELVKLARAGWTTEQLRQYIASGQLQPSLSLLCHPPHAAPATAAGHAAAASWTAFQNACKHPGSAQVPIKCSMYSQSSPSQCTRI